MEKHLAFWTTGEYITSLARDMFYNEHRDWDYIEKLLLHCMSGTDTPEETLKQYGKDLLAGRRCLVGSTKDGSYGLVDDTEHPELAAQFEKEMCLRKVWGDNWPKAKREAEAALAERRERQMDLVAKNWVSSFLENERAEREHGTSYGWVAPDGTFYPVEWGDHQKWAREYLKKQRGCDFGELPLQERNCPGDVLVERGWMLLHNPGLGVPVVTREMPLTEPQKEFLFDFYTERGRNDLAVALYAD